jgi:hypothetical protein
MLRTLLLCVAVSAGLLSGPADARHDRDRGGQNQQQQVMQPDGWRDNSGDRGERRAAEAGRRAQQRNGGGRVLSVEPEGSGYRVKVLKEGEVRTHHVEDQD